MVEQTKSDASTCVFRPAIVLLQVDGGFSAIDLAVDFDDTEGGGQVHVNRRHLLRRG